MRALCTSGLRDVLLILAVCVLFALTRWRNIGVWTTRVPLTVLSWDSLLPTSSVARVRRLGVFWGHRKLGDFPIGIQGQNPWGSFAAAVLKSCGLLHSLRLKTAWFAYWVCFAAVQRTGYALVSKNIRHYMKSWTKKVRRITCQRHEGQSIGS